MEWGKVLNIKPDDVEADKELLEDIYTFLTRTALPESVEEAPPELQGSGDLLKALHVLCAVVREKGLDARAAEEELRDVHTRLKSATAHINSPEHRLVEQVTQLEKELQLKDETVERLMQQIGTTSPSVASRQVRHFKEEIEDLNRELTELKRSLGQERVENQRLMKSASTERVKSRQLEREVDTMRHNLDDYRKQLDWQREQVGGAGARGTVEADCRERLRKKDLELAQQLDKIEELLNGRDNLEEQLREVTLQLGHVEEQRLVALKDVEAMRGALVESDSHCDELEAKTKLLEGQVMDLQEQLTQHTVADEQVVNLVHSRAQEWEGILSSKEAELEECRERVSELEGELRAVENNSNHCALILMKKELQSREAELLAVQRELGDATAHITNLNSQLEQMHGRGDTGLVNNALKQELERAQFKVKALENDLGLEVHRREQAELDKEQRDVELTQALSRLAEYEHGEYGLHEAVTEIKVKKEELAVRDKDISELTRQVNHLDAALNQFSEENEVLRGKLGLGAQESVDVSGVRGRRAAEVERLRKDNRMLQNEVERLEEAKLSQRKQLLDYAIAKRSPAHLDQVDAGLLSHTHSLVEVESRVRDLEKACNEERRDKEAFHGEAKALKGRLKQTQEKLKLMKVIVKELKEGKESQGVKSEAMGRLIALLEVEGSGNDIALVLQLKTQLSQQEGQREVLNQQLQRAEAESRHALKELERKQYESEGLQKEVVALKKQQAGFRPVPLPEGMPPASSDVIASLNEQLLHSLNRMHSREEALEEARGALERLQRKFAVIIHQQGVLYMEYKAGRAKWEQETEHARLERQKLLAEREHDKIKAQNLEDLQVSLAGDGEEMHRRLGEMSRKLTLLQVNEKVLSRKQQLLQEREAGLRKENSQLLHEKVWIEKAVMEKISYLQRHKEASLFKLKSLQQQLSESVSCAEMDRANEQLNQQAIKYQLLLSQQTMYTASTASVERLQAEVCTLTNQLNEVKQELSLEKQKNTVVGSSGSGGDSAGTGEGHGKLATMEMQLLNEKQRAELANARWQQMQGVMTQLEQRNAVLEEKFSELTQRLLQAQVKEGELRDQLSCSLPLAEKSSLEHNIAQLQKSECQLRINNNHLKEVAEIARQQAIAMEMVQKSHDLEVSSLRQQLLDLQSGSEEKTTVGRLHHQVLALQISEATALKRQEEMEAKVMKLEANLLQAEQQRSRESEALFQCRAEATTRVRHLRGTIQALRLQYSGSIPLSECEQHAALILKGKEDRMEAEMLREDARKDRDQAKVENLEKLLRNGKTKLMELEAQQLNLEELVASLRDSNPGSAAARLTEWHAKLGNLRLVELRLTRTNQQLTERVAHLEGVVSASEKAFTKLEQDLVTVTKDYEASQLSWEQREAQLEKQLEAWSLTTSRPDHLSLDPQLSASGQLQETLQQLQESSRDKALLTQRLHHKEGEVRHLEKALAQVRGDLLEKEGMVVRLRDQVESAKREKEAESSERDENQMALRSSMGSVKQLKAELCTKDQLVDKYQLMIQDMRREHQQEIDGHRQEAATLREQLNTQADTAFSQLKQAAVEAANVPMPVVPTDRQLERLLQLEDLTAQQQQEIKRLQQQVDSWKKEKESCEQSYEARIAKIKQESKELTSQYKKEMEELRRSLSEQSSRVTELEQEVEVLEGELSAAQQAAKQAPSRTMKSLVDRLRNQLSVKEKQQRALSQALLQVRADLVEAAQKTLEGEAGKEEIETDVNRLVGQKTQELNQQVLYLSSRLDEVKGELSECQSREVRSQEELERVKGDLEGRGTVAKTMEAELQRKWKALEQAKGREDKLIQKLQQLQTEVENCPLVLELRNRVKVLQGKLDKQKELTNTLEESLRAHPKPQEKAVAIDTGPGAEASTSKSSKQQAVEVVRWEEGKKWQKKLDGARSKLAEKTKELEAVQKQVSLLREIQSRSDREKSILNAKVKSLQRLVSEGNERPPHSHEEGRTVGGHSVEDLEKVVLSLKKVVSKLQSENESLKKSSAAARPAHSRLEGGKKATALQEENNRLKMEIQQLHQASASIKSVVAENERLARDYKKEVAKTGKLQLSLSTLQIQHDKLTQEVERFNKSAAGSVPVRPALLVSSEERLHVGGRGELEVKVEQLQAEVEKKTAMLMEVKRHLKEAAEREKEIKNISSDAQFSERYMNVVKERDSFKLEIDQLRKELDAFDPSFFEEIEDLKFNYQQSVRKIAELEDQLSSLKGQQGLSAD